MKDGRVKCKRCNGKGEYRVRVYFEDNAYYYFEKCGNCYAKGYFDWIEAARGRLPGISGFFCDTHPAGSMFVNGTGNSDFGDTSIYDGHNYISIKTERGKALLNELNN